MGAWGGAHGSRQTLGKQVPREFRLLPGVVWG